MGCQIGSKNLLENFMGMAYIDPKNFNINIK